MLLFDYFRIPYRVVAGLDASAGLGRIRPASGGPSLVWPIGGRNHLEPRLFEFGGLDVYARERLIDDPPAESVVLPFDPDEAILSLWSEAYLTPTGASGTARAKRLAMRGYYAARPAMPRSFQIWLRRRFSRIQARTRFPRWPVETALHDLYDLLLGRLAALAGEPVPTIAPWPDPYRWALVLSHDVERRPGYENLHLLADVEKQTGFRSSWNFVPERDYTVAEERLDQLRADGFEVGLHGLYHDGRDLESRATLDQRLPAMRRYAEQWGAVGFRSPATHRDWELMPLLGFDYDSSSPDTDPFEPKSGGCCSWLPFFNRELVELPITLTQDHTVFVILEQADDSLWREKTEFLRGRGGMALLLTHPDYMLEPNLVELYRAYLGRYAGDETAWKPLPREVSAWWRRRGASSVVRVDGGWSIEGPAADEGRVELVEPH